MDPASVAVVESTKTAAAKIKAKKRTLIAETAKNSDRDLCLNKPRA